MAFTFPKNDRNFSNITFPFMRKVIIGTSNLLFNVRVTHRHNMPLTGPCFIYGNHSNYFDPFFINTEMTAEPTAGVMTRDQFHKTLPRIFMDSIGIVPTSKYIPEPGIIRSVMKMIDKRRMIVIFPEGGRRWDGRPKPLIETTLKLFWKMKIPIHPVQLHGSYLSWPRWASWPRRSSVEARFLDPLHVSDFDNFEDFAQSCRSKMEFEEYSPPASTVPFSSWQPAAGIDRILYRCPETGKNAAVFTPDGDRVCSRAYPLKYTLDHASRLIDAKGQKHSLIELYDRINAMEMVLDKDDCLLEENNSRFYSIGKDHNLVNLGQGTVTLTPTEIQYQSFSESEQIPLEQIRYISVEQNHKVSITDQNRTFRFTLKTYSALQWQLYLRRLLDGEKP
ncbi:MAG: lysophospholipid acyltransferase family protein, partial [Balneolaceae bacterium]